MSSLSIPGKSPQPIRAAVWWLRLLLAVLFFSGAHLLIWADPLNTTLLELMLLLIGFLVLGVLVLDLAARYRIHSIYEAMMVIAVYGLLAGLLLYPQTTFVDLPRTLVTRGIGAQALTGLIMFGLFLTLTGGHRPLLRRNLLGAALWVGFYWGTWVRWSPSQIGWAGGQEVSLGTMLGFSALLFTCIGALFLVATRKAPATLHLPDFQLSPAGFGVLMMLLMILFIIRVLQGYITGGALLLTLLLIGVCWLVLWFQRVGKSRTLLDEHLPPRPLPLAWAGGALLLMMGMTMVAYHLPLLDVLGYSQLTLMELGFAVVGFGWFPVVVGHLGVQAYERQTRTQKI